jgi:hypothetical protein
MKLIINHFNFFKKGITLIAGLFFFSICSFAQDSQAIPVATSTSDQPTSVLKLTKESQNAKVLFERAHKVSLTAEVFMSNMKTSKENLIKWQKVQKDFKNDPKVDLTFIQQVVEGMEQKLQWKE